MAAESSKGIKQFKVPHVYAIIFALMVISSLFSRGLFPLGPISVRR